MAADIFIIFVRVWLKKICSLGQFSSGNSLNDSFFFYSMMCHFTLNQISIFCLLYVQWTVCVCVCVWMCEWWNDIICTQWYVFINKRKYNDYSIFYIYDDKFTMWLKFERFILCFILSTIWSDCMSIVCVVSWILYLYKIRISWNAKCFWMFLSNIIY